MNKKYYLIVFLMFLLSAALLCTNAYAGNGLKTAEATVEHSSMEDSVNSILPDAERNALIALYNATGGDNWQTKTNWKKTDGTFNDPGTEGSWYGITVDNSHVVTIDLYENGLTGVIPSEIGNVTNLRTFGVFQNHLSGQIPVELGNLINLELLDLSSNMLSGEIPSTLVNLTAIQFINLDLNSLHSDDDLLKAYLSDKGSEWESYQTVAPTNVSASCISATVIHLQWTPIEYKYDTGRYTVCYSQTPGGPYTEVGSTADKWATGYNVPNLTPGVQYYFVVKTVTDSNPANLNTVISEYTSEISGIYLSVYTLSVSSSPEPGTTISVSPADSNGLSSGVTGFTRSYYRGNNVTVTAPASFNGRSFRGWNVDGVTYNDASITLSMTNHRNADALYDAAPVFTVTAPNGGELVPVSSNRVITWTCEGDVDFVKLEYSLNNGNYWVELENATENDGSFTWSVPSWAISPQCLIRVSDVSGFSGDVSDAPFYTVGTSLPLAERNALIAFYNSTNGDNWRNNTNWKTADGQFSPEGTEDSWTGVKVVNGHVTELVLSSQLLSGTLPDALRDLTSLTVLDLNINNLTGSIPSSIAEIQSLRNLDLRVNEFTGTIPPELGNLSNLTNLNLFSNHLTGDIPVELANLSLLESLHLSNNELSGPIPPELGGMSNLKLLSLGENQLTGPIPVELGNLSSLYYVSLRNNQLEGTIPVELSNLPGLKTLLLDGNRLTGTIPSELGNLTLLGYLRLGRNHLSGTVPTELGNLVNITDLFLNGNQLKGPLPDSLMNLSKLTVACDLGYNMFYTDNENLRTFLNSKDSNWEATQTVPPENVSVQTVESDSITLTWTPIQYTSDGGGYEIHYSTISGGPYSLYNTTNDKSVSTLTVTGLNPATEYYFVVRTKTPAHDNEMPRDDNDNLLESEFTPEVSGTTLVPAFITVTTPNGGETWQSGSLQSITWATVGNVGNVKLEYSTSGINGTYTTIVDSIVSTGSYSWMVPDVASSQCVIRISDVDGSPVDTSDAVFTIEPAPIITLVAPNGGERFIRGTSQTISWTQENISGNVTLQLFKGDVHVLDLGTAPAEDMVFNWIIPSDITPDADYRIRISQDFLEDFSDTYFTIVAPVHPDFNGDGHTDLFWRHNVTGENGVWMMNGIIRTDIVSLPTLSTDWVKAGTADFNSDIKTDILWRNVTTGENGVWMMNGTTRSDIVFLPSLRDTNWKCGGLGDFNGDGKPDILWRHQINGKIGVWMMNGASRIDIVFLPTLANTDWLCAGVGDFNGDGKPDILWHHQVTGENGVWMMDGTVRIDIAFLPTLSDTDWLCAGVGDFNDDGKPDILWRHQVTGENGVWYMNGTARNGQVFFNTLSDTNWEL